jgi:DNA-binding transcriptional LysR family regulator
MDLNRVAVFVRVVESGSFTAAAAALGHRKSSVSRSVAKLEDELGVKLLHRTTRRLTLTEAGSSYFNRVRDAVLGVEDATSVVRELGHEPRGTVRLTAPHDIDPKFLSGVIARFVRQYPKVRVDLVLTSRAVDLVDERIDLALRAGRVDDPSLVVRKIVASQAALFASPDYLRRRGHPRTLSDLAAHDCVLYRPQSGKSSWRLTGPSGDESIDVTGPIGADGMSFVVEAAASGAGIALVPTQMARQNVERGTLERVLAEYELWGALYVVAPASRYQLARVRLLRDFLVKGLAKFDG